MINIKSLFYLRSFDWLVIYFLLEERFFILSSLDLLLYYVTNLDIDNVDMSKFFLIDHNIIMIPCGHNKNTIKKASNLDVRKYFSSKRVNFEN